MTRHGAVDILLDPGDSAEVTRGLLARNCPQRGLVVIHPAAESQSPAHDMLQALGVSVRSLHADRIHTQAAAWNAALAWARTARVTRIVLLRAHRLSPAVWPELCALSAQIGADVLLVFHQAWVPARWDTALADHPTRTFQSLDQVAAAYQWQAPRDPYRRPAPRTYPPLPAPLPSEPVLNWRAAAYRALPAADFARADTLYGHGFAAACAWIGEYRQLGPDVDERIQALLVGLVHDSPTPWHTLAQLRGAQAGFLAHGQHLAIPDLTGLGGPGLTSTALTDDLAARIRAGTGNPVLAAGLALALITGLDLPELLGFAVEDLSGSCHQVRIPLQYALSSHGPEGERGYHLAAELLQPDSGGAVFHVPRPARPLIRAAYLYVLGAGRSIPHHRLLGGGGKPLAGWIRAAAERCGVALPDRTVTLDRLWQLRVHSSQLGVTVHPVIPGAGCTPARKPVQPAEPRAAQQATYLAPGDRPGPRWSPGDKIASGQGLDTTAIADVILRLARAHATGETARLPPTPVTAPLAGAALARELVERHVAVRVPARHPHAALPGLDLHPDILFALQLTDRPAPAAAVAAGGQRPGGYTVLRSPVTRADSRAFATPRPSLRPKPCRGLAHPVAPYANETWRSYQRRLELTNDLADGSLPVLVGYPRGSRPLPTGVYATLTGLARNTLLHALPELAAIEGHPHPLLTDGAGQPLQRYLRQRYACVLCTAARGVTSGHVDILTLDDRSVCVRHQRWIGSRSMPHNTEQTDISGLPDMVTAHIRHRNLVRRYGRARTQQRYLDALDILRFWAVRGYWARARHARMKRLCGREITRIAPANPLLDLVIYPEVVALTGIIASPFWRDFSIQQIHWQHRHEQRLFTEINDRLGFVGYRFEQASDPLLRYLHRVAVSAGVGPAAWGEARWLESA